MIRKISVITPCYNAENYIEETIRSVVLQSALIKNSVDLEYIIVDGHSSDRTLEIVRKYQNDFNIKLISEPDNGMYDAICKGLKHITGEITCYLNAGDIYYPKAFEIITNIFANNEIKWLTGIKVHYNENSEVISTQLPFRYLNYFILRGQYGRNLPYIQQESTFWKSELNSSINIEKLKGLELSGDYYLWWSFAKRSTSLHVVESILGGFKIHSGQLSERINEYNNEIGKYVIKSSPLTHILSWIERLLWILPIKGKKFLNKNIISYSTENNKWE